MFTKDINIKKIIKVRKPNKFCKFIKNLPNKKCYTLEKNYLIY